MTIDVPRVKINNRITINYILRKLNKYLLHLFKQQILENIIYQ